MTPEAAARSDGLQMGHGERTVCSVGSAAGPPFPTVEAGRGVGAIADHVRNPADWMVERDGFELSVPIM